MSEHEPTHPRDPHHQHAVEDDRTHPTGDHPLHGERRSLARPTLAVLGLLVAIAVVFALITWARYNT